MNPRSRGVGERRSRAQSAPLGLLLVFALVIAATTLIVALGVGTITDSQDRLDSERTEKALTQLDSQAALVALGSSEVQTVDISAVGTDNYVVNDSAGQMTLGYENQTDGTTTTIFSRDLGRIVYEGSSGSSIAYQGGGVWRSDGAGGSVMVSPPEFHYRDATLTLPLVVVGSSGTIDNRARISQGNSTQRFPNTTANGNFTNPLENARVQVTVTSEYYRAWGEYFETRTEGEVEYDDANEQVTLALVTPLENTEVSSASSSLSAGGTFTISGSAPSLCSSDRRNYTDSYDSSGTSDGYCEQTTGDDGDLVYGGDVDISAGTGGGGGVRNNLYGDVVSGGRVTVTNGDGDGQPYVFGNINHTGQCNPDEEQCESRIRGDGTRTQISGIDESPPIDGIVRTQIDEIERSNDNDSTGNITDGTLNYTNSGTSDTVELDSGTYYLDEIDVTGGDTVLLNTTDGDITIAVEENVVLGDGAAINVTGEGGEADVYVQGAGGNDDQLELNADSSVTNPGDDGPQFQVFGPSNLTVQIGTGGDLANYTGVIFAPPGTSGTSNVTLDGGIIYGGLVTGDTLIANGGGGSIHYDEALDGLQVLERSDSVVRVTYIHASTNEITVEDG